MVDVKTRETENPDIRLFGIPIIQTKCQADCQFYGIIGGFSGGLISYLFTSQIPKSMNIAVGCYLITTGSYAVYCMRQFREAQKQRREFQKIMYETSLRKTSEKNTFESYNIEDNNK